MNKNISIWAIGFLVFFLTPHLLLAQRVTGTIVDENGRNLPFTTISIKGNSTWNTLANNQAQFDLQLPQGSYKLVAQHVGYETNETDILVEDKNTAIKIVLKAQRLMMQELVISNSGENPAYAIIRNAIKQRASYNKQIKLFSCDLYTKDLIKLRNLPNKVMGQKIDTADRKNMGLDSLGSGIIYLSESFSEITSKPPSKLKMNVKYSRVSGSNGFGFTFSSLMNFYENQVDVFDGGLNSRGFISPISEGALYYYKYRMMGTFVENGKTIYTIKVTPKRSYEPLFTGIINIVDLNWRIHSFELMATKSAQLQLMDTLKITQFHQPVSDEVWTVNNQSLYFNLKFFGIDVVGHNVSVFTKYLIDPKIEKKFFDNVVIKYDSGVTKQQKSFWDTARPVPLSFEELQNYRVKDSSYKANQDSIALNSSVDSLRKRQGKIKWKNIFHAGVQHKHYGNKNRFSWGIDPLLLNSGYNTIEGVYTDLTGYWTTSFPKRTKLRIEPHIRYGFNNTHLNSWVDFSMKGDFVQHKINTGKWEWSGSVGKKIAQFNDQNPVTPLSNSIATLFYGINPMKIYEKTFFDLQYQRSWESGFKMKLSTHYADRNPLNNSSDFSFVKDSRNKFTINDAITKNTDSGFLKHQAVYATVEISVSPGQQFIQFPNRKVSIGTKYPTFTARYSKGIPGILSSDVNFDKWEFEVQDDMKLKLAGLLKYKLSCGGFLNSKSVFKPDLKHFNSNIIRTNASYVSGFELMDSYINSNNAKFCTEGHIEHHFNGLITNKIPYFKKLNWNLIAGSNAYFIDKKDNYVEVFFGLENILKFLRLDLVMAYQQGKYVRTSVAAGFGGLLGNSIPNGEKSSNSISIGF